MAAVEEDRGLLGQPTANNATAENGDRKHAMVAAHNNHREWEGQEATTPDFIHLSKQATIGLFIFSAYDSQNKLQQKSVNSVPSIPLRYR
jgi:hypothetical protein